MRKIIGIFLLIFVFIIPFGSINAEENFLSNNYNSKVVLVVDNFINKIDNRNLSIDKQIDIYKKLNNNINTLKGKYNGKKLLILEYIQSLINKKLVIINDKIKCSGIDLFKDELWFNSLNNEYFYDNKKISDTDMGGNFIACYYKEHNMFVFANMGGLFNYNVSDNVLIKSDYPYITFEMGGTDFIPYDNYIEIKSFGGGGESGFLKYAKFYVSNQKVELYKDCTKFYIEGEKKWDEKCNYTKKYFNDYNDGDYELIKNYYKYISSKKYEEAYNMKYEPLYGLSKFKELYGDVNEIFSSLEDRYWLDVEKISENEYKFKVHLYLNNGTQEKYLVQMKIIGDKIKTISSVKIN